MSVQKSLPLLAALCMLPGVARADKLDKDAKAWLEQVHPIMLVEEEKSFRELSDKADRLEFQKIFWARRDPNLDTPENEYQAQYDKARAEADVKYKSGGRPGSQTDCGRVFILLGAPDDAKEVGGQHSWVFKDRPGVKFKDGQTTIEFDQFCMLPEGARLADQMNQMAEGKIAHPNLQYAKTADGHITKLVDQLPKDTPVQALLKSPRADFPIAAQQVMFLRSPGGSSYIGGLLKGDLKGTTKVLVVTQITDAAGQVSTTPERESLVEETPDGFLTSWGMALKPGPYTVKVGALDAVTKKGAVANLNVTVPDFSGDELKVAPLLVLADIQEGKTPAPQDAMSAFTLGTTRMIPHFDNVFTKADSVTILTVLYNPMVDPATGKASTTATYTITKDGKSLAKADDQNFDTPNATPSVGPVPMSTFAPGKYKASLKVKDNVAKKEQTVEVPFEVR